MIPIPCYIIGFGIVTTKPFAKGEFLLEYTGNLLTKEAAVEMEKKHNRCREGSFMYYFVYQGKELWYVSPEINS